MTTQTEGELRVETKYENSPNQLNVSVQLTIRRPSDVPVGAVRTANGSIGVDITEIEDAVEIRTANGSIDAALSPNLGASISATTDNGSIDVRNLELSSKQRTRTSVSGSLGDGTHDLTFETENGSILLSSRSD